MANTNSISTRGILLNQIMNADSGAVKFYNTNNFLDKKAILDFIKANSSTLSSSGGDE